MTRQKCNSEKDPDLEWDLQDLSENNVLGGKPGLLVVQNCDINNRIEKEMTTGVAGIPTKR